MDSTWYDISRSLQDLLAERGLENVEVRRASEPPQQIRGGKFATVIPWQD